LLLDARRYKRLGRRELAGALWLPALAAVTVVEAWMQMQTVVAVVLVALLLIGFVVFAFSGERKAR
jgi:sugar phosphate permease